MNVTVCCVALGGWYPRGAARLIQEFASVSNGYRIEAHVNTLPAGAPAGAVENLWSYTGYTAKPFAMMEARLNGADICLLMDCAFYPIRHIGPLVDHIARNGYYFCRNGYQAGEWMSDRALERMGMSRDEAMTVEEISSYCVGLNFTDGRCIELLQRWCGFAADKVAFMGPHTNVPRWTSHSSEPISGRNPGWCSDDPRCKGHRHDQSVLSILAHRIGMRELTNRPRFTAYAGSETAETVLVNQGL